MITAVCVISNARSTVRVMFVIYRMERVMVVNLDGWEPNVIPNVGKDGAV